MNHAQAVASKLVSVLTVVYLGMALRASSQQAVTARNFNQREFFPAPHGDKVKTWVSGGEATPLPGGKTLIKRLKITTYQESGQTKMVVEAPECVYDLSRHLANSDGSLKAHTGDGRFFIEGNGFLWQQADSNLAISNQVHSVLEAQTGTNAPAGPPTEIFSDGFEFESKTGTTVYHGQVRVNDPKMKLRCETLTAKLPASGGRIDRIVAERNVIIDASDESGGKDKEETHATGDKAVYTYKVNGKTTNEVIELTGNPLVERSIGRMTADVVTMDRGSGRLRGTGNHRSVIKMQLGKQAQTKAPETPETIILSDNFEFEMNTRQAVYEGSVRVIDPKLNRTNLVSETLTATLPEAGGRVDRIVAQTNVVLDSFNEKGERTRATGQKAVYTYKETPGKTNEIVELTGKPKLEQPNGWMTADVITMDRATGMIQGAGHHHSSIKMTIGEGSAGATPAASMTDIFSDQFEFGTKTRQAIYLGGVRVDDPRLKLTGERLTARLPETGGRIDRIVTETNVVINALEDKGAKTHATADKAVYTWRLTGGTTNEVVELTGNPMVGRPVGWTTADVIFLDRATGAIRSIGNSYTKIMIADLGTTNRTTIPRRVQ